MIDIIRKEISFASDAEKIEVLNKGLSVAKLFVIYKDNKKFILKIYMDNSIDRIEITKRYIEVKQPIPHIHDYGKTETFTFYVIMDYIENGTLEDNYNSLNCEEINKLSIQLGKYQSELDKRFNNGESDFFDKFKESELKKLDNTIELINKNKDKLPIIDKFDIKRIEVDFKELIEYFNNDKCFYMHMDLKADNLMYDDGNLLMIDYENSQLTYLPTALRCEIHHIVKEDKYKEKSIAFIKGIIEGIDKEQIQDKNLNKKLAFAYLKSAFVYIVGFYLKNGEYEKANKQLEDIVEAYENNDIINMDIL